MVEAIIMEGRCTEKRGWLENEFGAKLVFSALFSLIVSA